MSVQLSLAPVCVFSLSFAASNVRTRFDFSCSYTAHFVFHPLAIQYLSLPLKQRPETVVDFAGFVLESIDHRQALALATQLVWSARLTFNAIRRGFFDFRSEDYRWPIYR